MALADQYRTMQGLVVEALRQRILSGELRPGEHMYQEQLADALGVSRQPVREALRQLEVEGFVTFVPHRGVVVRELSREDIEELYVLRCALEGFAAEQAARNFSLEVIVRMKACLARMEGLRASGDSGSEFLIPDSEFHYAMYEATGRKSLLHRIVELERMSRRYVRTYIELPGSQDRAIATHRSILAAVESGNPRRIRRAVVSHLSSTVMEVLATLDAHASVAEARERMTLAKGETGRPRQRS